MKEYPLYLKGKEDEFYVRSDGDIVLNDKIIGKSRDIAEVLKSVGEMFQQHQEITERFNKMLKDQL